MKAQMIRFRPKLIIIAAWLLFSLVENLFFFPYKIYRIWKNECNKLTEELSLLCLRTANLPAHKDTTGCGIYFRIEQIK